MLRKTALLSATLCVAACGSSSRYRSNGGHGNAKPGPEAPEGRGTDDLSTERPASYLTECRDVIFTADGSAVNLISSGKSVIVSPSENSWTYTADTNWTNFELTSSVQFPAGESDLAFGLYGSEESPHYVYRLSSQGKAVCGLDSGSPWPCTGGETESLGSLAGKLVGFKTIIGTNAEGNVTVQSFARTGTGGWLRLASETNPQGHKLSPPGTHEIIVQTTGVEAENVRCLLAQRITSSPPAHETTAPSTPPATTPTDPVVPEPDKPAVTCEASDEICAIEAAILKYTNDVRARNGKPPLKGNYKMDYGARHWSDQQAMQGRISHDGFPTERESAIKAKYGETIKVLAENVASHSQRSSRTPDEIAKKFVIEQWENSPGHFKNMIGNYKELGAGVSKRNGSYYATQIFR